MTDATLGHIAPAGLAALAAFAARLDEPVGEWKGGDTLDEDAISMPWFAASAMVNDFVAAAYEHGLVVPFDWSDWMSDGGRDVVFADPAAMAAYPLADVQRTVTAIIRGDRFAEGALAEAFTDGRMPALIRRLAALAGTSAA